MDRGQKSGFLRAGLSPRRPGFCRIFRALTACALGAAAVSLVSCDLFTYKRPFDDAYYDNNFIAGIGFDNFVGSDGPGAIWADPTAGTGVALFPDGNGQPIPVTGSWDFSYRYDASWESDGGAYMSLTPTSVADGDPGTTAADFGTVPDGLAGTAPVFRLELANLVTGGDFEAGSVGAEWSTDGAVSSSVSILSSGSTGLSDGAGVYVSLTDAGAYAEYSLSQAFTTGFSLFPGQQYLLGFLSDGKDVLAGVTDAGVSLDEDVDKLTPLMQAVSPGAYRSEFLFQAGGTDALRFQIFQDPSIVVDHMTLKRGDLGLQLRLLLTRDQAVPVLESLLYKFTYWIREDSLAVPANPGAAPYRLDTLKSAMSGVPGNSSLSSGLDPLEYAYDSSSVGWKKMTAYVENGNLQFESGIDGADPVLELTIDLSDARPGRILIAQPELRAYPDGY